ncbi:MAG: metallophosphoesterase [Xanthomonadales bacterium]|nr:metallophosphoesterase [Xanthomonadales bacterium]
MRLVHLTDPHLSTLDGEKLLKLRGKRWSGYLSWRKNRRNHHLPAVLNNLVDAVRAETADQILLTGDLVHIGLDSEITQAAEWLTTLGPAGKVMLVPGNHDIYGEGSAEAVLQSWSDYLFQPVHGSEPEQVAGQFPVVRKLGKLSLIGLSTACVTPVFMATGELGDEQLQRLAVLLQQAAAEGQMVALLIHHPPLPGMTHWRKALADAAALETVLKQFPPSLIFYGHLHYNREQQLGDTRIYCTAAASSVCDASYRVIDIDDRENSREFRMSLKSLSIEAGAKPAFVTIDEQSWQVSK